MNAKWITPAVTAMDSQGHVDMEANKAIYDFLIEKGMDGLLLLGSIGEFFAISTPEKKRLIREALAHIHHRTTVYVGTCEMNLEACVELSQGELDLKGQVKVNGTDLEAYVREIIYQVLSEMEG